MKTFLIGILALGFLASCGIGNSVGNSASSAGSSATGSSAGSASSLGSGLFGRRADRARAADPTLLEDGRRLIYSVKEARFERTKAGGIIRARAIAPRQGYYNAALVSPTGLKPDEKGVLTLEFRVEEPNYNTGVSTERSREVNVAIFVSNQKLAAAKAIRVVARQNQISIRR